MRKDDLAFFIFSRGLGNCSVPKQADLFYVSGAALAMRAGERICLLRLIGRSDKVTEEKSDLTLFALASGWHDDIVGSLVVLMDQMRDPQMIVNEFITLRILALSNSADDFGIVDW